MTGVPIAAVETQFIVKLQKIRRPYGLPGPDQAGGDLPVLFRSLRLDVNPVTE